jgi:hypothetical protein
MRKLASKLGVRVRKTILKVNSPGKYPLVGLFLLLVVAIVGTLEGTWGILQVRGRSGLGMVGCKQPVDALNSSVRGHGRR